MGIVLELEDITIAGPKSRVNSRASVPSKSFSPDNTSQKKREFSHLSISIMDDFFKPTDQSTTPPPGGQPLDDDFFGT